MSIHTPTNKRGIYFITFTCFNWLHLFNVSNSYDLVYNWFDVLSSKGHWITGYVIMPNHIHLLLYYSGEGKSLNTIIGNGKRFMAYEIVDRLKDLKEFELLRTLNKAVEQKDRIRGKLHEIWEDSFDIKECRTEKFILQKLNYIHFNPCTDKWKLSERTYDYFHSSASFYELGLTNYSLVKDYRDFLYLLND